VRQSSAASREQWLAAGAIWIAAGFAFPFLAPATTWLSEGLQRYLISAAGMPDDLALRVAFTIVRIPLTAVLAALVAAAQCAAVRDLRSSARRWVVAAAIGACIATVIFLPSSLAALAIAGDISQGPVRIFLLVVPGAGLLGGLVSLVQRRAARGHLTVPGWLTGASAAAAVLGVLGRVGLGR
jgi:hypothetical protein